VSSVSEAACSRLGGNDLYLLECIVVGVRVEQRSAFLLLVLNSSVPCVFRSNQVW